MVTVHIYITSSPTTPVRHWDTPIIWLEQYDHKMKPTQRHICSLEFHTPFTMCIFHVFFALCSQYHLQISTRLHSLYIWMDPNTFMGLFSVLEMMWLGTLGSEITRRTDLSPGLVSWLSSSFHGPTCSDKTQYLRGQSGQLPSPPTLKSSWCMKVCWLTWVDIWE